MAKNRRLIWDEQALIEVERSLEWIGKTSLHQTELVEQAILSRIELIRVHPERFPPDKYKINNQGSYRAFETHSYRISYYHTENEVRILRCRHVKQRPKKY